MHAKQRREELPHLLQVVRRGVGGLEEKTAPGLSRQLQGQWDYRFMHVTPKFVVPQLGESVLRKGIFTRMGL